MADFFETTSVRDEPAHWDALAQRVTAKAERESKNGAIEWLAQSRTGWIAACLLLAVTLLSVASAVGSSVRSRDSEWMQLLAPVDGVGRAIVVSDSPPAIGALLVRVQGGT